MSEKRVPDLRFKGFSGDWEERKLSDLFIKGGSGGTPKSTNKAFYDGDIPFLGISDITKSNGFINNTEKHISSDGLNSSAAWIVSKGAISLAMYASVGKLAILNIDAATSQAFYNMIFDDYDLRDLVYQRLNKANELSEWNKLISTGTQANLNADKVKNFQMYLPKNHDEIKLISTFFKQIDNTIALHQRKLELLKQLKQGFLQQMFVRDGEKEPKLRFADFGNDWELRKFEDFTKISQGLQIAISNRFLNKGKNRLFYITNEFLNPNSSVKYYIENASKSVIANLDDILMTRTGNTGKVVTNVHGAFHNNFFKIAYDESKTNKLFLYFLLNSDYVQNEIRIGAGSSTIPDLKHPNFYRIKVRTTSLEEQTKIGNFFKQLDDTITLHHNKLEQLQSLKKGYLKALFI